MSYNNYRLASEISNAILRGEQLIKIGEHKYQLPKGQTTGTYWQRRCYADKKAIQFLENMDLYAKKEE